MNKYNNLIIRNIIGGGNLGASKLAKTLHAFAPGRLPSFSQTVAVALFVFAGLPALSSCSGGDDYDTQRKAQETAPASPDYAALLTAPDWTVVSAKQRLGSFWANATDAEDCYCHLSADSIDFSKGETVNYFDEEGNIKEVYEVTPCGKYPYAVTGNEIQISNQTFIITINTQRADSTLVLDNQDWKLELAKKQ